MPKGTGTQALIQGKSHAKNLLRTIDVAGVRRRNDKYPEWKVTLLTTPRGGEVVRRNQ